MYLSSNSLLSSGHASGPTIGTALKSEEVFGTITKLAGDNSDFRFSWAEGEGVVLE